MLDAHPAIHMFGETEFIVATLWKYILEIREKSLIAIDDPDQLHREMASLGKVGLNIMNELFGLNSLSKPMWGIKEIWNGAKGVDWAIYDLVFPKATWVHLVRNPLDYARSAIRWKGLEMNEVQLETHIKRWAMMVDVSRERMSTGRFVEIRYEDLATAPEAALAPMFAVLELPYATSCEAPLHQSWAVSNSPSCPLDVQVAKLMAATGVEELLDDLGYEVCDDESALGTKKPLQIRAGTAHAHWRESVGGSEPGEGSGTDPGRIGFEKFLILDPGDMSQETGHAFRYWAPLLTFECDDISHPARSNYLLTENGNAIGLPHSMHTDIREKGNGLWSHWGQTIFFSSSDGTDPRLNGREYALIKPLKGYPAPKGAR